jgi:hypothetical protein
MYLITWTPQLKQELGSLPEEVRTTIRARRHPQPGLAVLVSRSVAGDQALRQLVDRYGQVRWDGSGWRVQRPQLRLPGF